MSKIRKLIDLDAKVIEILTAEAAKQNRSLKSMLEHTIEQKARKLDEPSVEYKEMMDEMLDRLAEGKLEYTPIEEIKKQYDL